MLMNRYEALLLLIGDVLVFYLALWLTLFVRYLDLPDQELWSAHAEPFSYLFGVSVLIYFISGLYDQHTTMLRARLPQLVTYGQLATVVVAALFFFFVPYFGITPKTNLAIFLGVSSVLVVVWRVYGTRFLGLRRAKNALILGSGSEMKELAREMHENSRYGLAVVGTFAPHEVEQSTDLQERLLEFMTEHDIQAVVADTRDPHMERLIPVFYNILFLRPGLMFFDAMELYEGIFRRIPISMLEHAWFLEHLTRQPRTLYDAYHRVFDVVVSIVLGAGSLIVLPLAALAIKLEDGGPVFITQRRVGRLDRPVAHIKLRSMTFNDETLADPRSETSSRTNKITRVGAFVRKTRIDELPQLWNVLRGDYSLIGPRPELPKAVAAYAEAIPYYNARHLITPGLSGWAQLNHQAHPHHALDIEETRNKLSYDLYYLKNRSLWLDVEIGLKTIKTLLSAMGR